MGKNAKTKKMGQFRLKVRYLSLFSTNLAKMIFGLIGSVVVLLALRKKCNPEKVLYPKMSLGEGFTKFELTEDKKTSYMNVYYSRMQDKPKKFSKYLLGTTSESFHDDFDLADQDRNPLVVGKTYQDVTDFFC